MKQVMFDITPNEKYACKIIERSMDEFPLTEEFYDFAVTNQIAAMAGHIIECKKTSTISTIERKFIDEHKRVKKYLDNYLAELDKVAALLSQNDIRIVALKNAGIARGIFDCTGCCPMGDLDLLVEKGKFLKAHELLLQFGYNFKYRSHLEKESIQNAIKSGGAEYWKELPTGEKLWLELQFRPVAGRWISEEQEPDTDGLIARSIPVPGTMVRLLAPEDNLLQVSLHTAKHSYVREPGFRLHTDVDRIVRNKPLDWDLFLTTVKKLKVKTSVYFSLLIPNLLLATPIPARVIEALFPGKIKTFLILSILKKAGLFNPVGKKFGKITFLLFNVLLYDSPRLLVTNLFPSKRKMMEMYNCTSGSVYYYYCVRFLNLLLKRQKT
jgi:hypothetical protein